MQTLAYGRIHLNNEVFCVVCLVKVYDIILGSSDEAVCVVEYKYEVCSRNVVCNLCSET